jgi:hypothetical protein
MEDGTHADTIGQEPERGNRGRGTVRCFSLTSVWWLRRFLTHTRCDGIGAMTGVTEGCLVWRGGALLVLGTRECRAEAAEDHPVTMPVRRRQFGRNP